MLTLINAMESHFRTSLVSNDMLNAWWSENPGSISSFLSTPKIQFVCVLWRVRAVCDFCTYGIYTNKYIHVYHITHILFG